ncbi:hypothetical protein V3391_05080 [Luteimonas sp. SMYT11W]|uniref:Uncharacterized protein n=1 Tax=Luteimonas flava TaxID=3115822 RepID=A0ABU7WC88_9GAMM
MESRIMGRLAETLKCVGIAALSLSACSVVLGREAARAGQTIIESKEAFVELLAALPESDPKTRVALLSRTADLEKRDLRHLTAHDPTAYFRSDAYPNSVGLVSVDYGVGPSWLDPERPISSIRFNFVERDADLATCVQFGLARAALGLPVDSVPRRVPTAALDVGYRQRDERKSVRANIGVATDGRVAPCLQAAWIRFHQTPRGEPIEDDQ